MIDCRTKHGQWQVEHYTIQSIANANNDFVQLCFRHKPKQLWGTNIKHVQFHDLNGKYTGFRLKQLK